MQGFHVSSNGGGVDAVLFLHDPDEAFKTHANSWELLKNFPPKIPVVDVYCCVT